MKSEENNKKFLDNNIIKELVRSGDISEGNLKNIYRKFCKKTHPDLTRKDSSDFQKTQTEYKEALTSLNEIREYFSKINLGNQEISLENIRHALYRGLKKYTLLGLHSIKIRMRPGLKERNAAVIQEVFYWARLYDNKFSTIFYNYNKIQLRGFEEWSRQKHYVYARRYFLRGIRTFFNYEKSKNIGHYRAAKSYLLDSLYSLKYATRNKITFNLQKFVAWLFSELENLHDYYENKKAG